MKKFIIYFLSLFFNLISSAQPNLVWQNNIGGTSTDVGYSIQKTSDGGNIIVGHTSSNDGDFAGNHGGSDVFVIKQNTNGNIEWQKCYGGSGNDFGESIKQTSDGGFVFCGRTSSLNGDVNGNHGGFNDSWVVKLNFSGQIEWDKCIGGTNSENALDVIEVVGGSFIVVGGSLSNNGDFQFNNGSRDGFISKLSSNGALNWLTVVGGSNDDSFNSLVESSDGGFVLIGTTLSNDLDITNNHGFYDGWVVKININGIKQWSKCLGGSDSEGIASIVKSFDNNFVLCGSTSSNNVDVSGNNGNLDIWVLKISELGNVIWQKCIGGTGNEFANAIIQTIDNGFILVGQTLSMNGNFTNNTDILNGNSFVTKIDEWGVFNWSIIFGLDETYDIFYDLSEVNDGGIVLIGETDGDLIMEGIVTIKLNSNIGLENKAFYDVKLYPNPTRGAITIESQNELEIRIEDLFGKEILNQRISNGKETIDISSLPNGLYFIKSQEGWNSQFLKQ